MARWQGRHANDQHPTPTPTAHLLSAHLFDSAIQLPSSARRRPLLYTEKGILLSGPYPRKPARPAVY